MLRAQDPSKGPITGELMTADPSEIVGLDAGMRALQAASTIGEVKEIRDKAEAVRKFAKDAKLGLTMQNKAATLKLEAERKAGQLLASMSLRGGDRRSNGHAGRLKLNDLGISQNQSKRWQLEAAVSDEEFCQFASAARHKGRELTSAGLLRFARCRQEGYRATDPRDIRCPQNGKPPRSKMMEGVDELQDHNRMLASIVAPLCESAEPVSLRVVEQKMIRRLIRESAELLTQLRKQLKKTDREDNNN